MFQTLNQTQLWVRSLLFQHFTYMTARNVLVERNLSSVLDLGCGGTGKLGAYFYPFTRDITGVDLPEVVDCLKDIPYGKWYSWNLNEPDLDLGRKFDLIISADNVEHLSFVSSLFEVIKRHSKPETFIVFSTPDASTVKTSNLSHKHSWTKDEFALILINNGFNIIEGTTVPELDSKVSYRSSIFVCKVKQ